jgi:hypothetical protein
MPDGPAYLDPQLPELVKAMADDIVALRIQLSKVRGYAPEQEALEARHAITRALRWSDPPLPDSDPLAELLHELIG